MSIHKLLFFGTTHKIIVNVLPLDVGSPVGLARALLNQLVGRDPPTCPEYARATIHHKDPGSCVQWESVSRVFVGPVSSGDDVSA